MPLNATTTTEEIESQSSEETKRDDSTYDADYNKLFLFPQAKIELEKLITSWSGNIAKANSNRKLRSVDINVEQLREKGDIAQGETFCVVRTIETNIEREKPAYLNYISGSRRQAIFKPLDTLDVNKVKKLEVEYTQGLTYPGWITPHEKVLDGAQTHGVDAVEILFDIEKPLHVSIEHIGFGKLFFNLGSTNIQNQKMLVLEKELTCSQLQELVRDDGFSEKQVKQLEEKKSETDKDGTNKIYKAYFKYKYVIHVAWFTLESGVDDWLKAPAKLFLGRKIQVPVAPEQNGSMMGGMLRGLKGLVGALGAANKPTEFRWEDQEETRFPIALFKYKETELPRILDTKGRVYLDSSKQETQTTLLTGYVNASIRASYFLASPKNPSLSGGGKMKQLDITIKNGAVIDQPMDFFHMDYPSSDVLRALSYLDTSNSNEAGQVNYSANNREDSRKTAEEIKSANKESSLLSSVAVTQYSSFYADIHGIVWPIVQSQAMQGLIRLLRDSKTRENDIEFIGQEFIITPAGDVDVIERAEKIQSMMQDWPVVKETGLATQFLADLMRLKYADQGENYATVIEQGDQVKALLAAVGQVLQGVVQDNPQVLAAMSPEEQQQLAQLKQQVDQVLGIKPEQQQQQQQQKVV